MTIIQKITNNILLIIAFFFAFVCAVFAQSQPFDSNDGWQDSRSGLALRGASKNTKWAPSKSQNKGANYLVAIGVTEYEKGDTQGAIHEFSKALMLDPDHEEAQYYLHLLGLEQGLYSGSTTVTSQIADLGEGIQVYRSQAAQLELEKEAAELKARELKARIERLEVSNKDKDEAIDRLNKSLDGMDVFSKRSKTHDGPPPQQVEVVHADKEYIVQEDFVEFEQETEAEQMEEMYYEAYGESLDYQQKLIELRERSADQYDYQDKLIHVLEDYLNLREDRLAYAEDDLMAKEIDLTRHGILLLSRMDDVDSMAKSYNRYMRRVGNEEFIVGEEERYLQALRERLEGTRDDLGGKESLLRRKNRELAFLHEQLQEAQYKIDDLLSEREIFLKAVKKKTETIRALE